MAYIGEEFTLYLVGLEKVYVSLRQLCNLGMELLIGLAKFLEDYKKVPKAR